MRRETHETLLKALERLLRPIVRILLRHGIPVQNAYEVLKKVYAEVARSDFSVPGRKPSISRIALLTGLTRKEASRLLGLPPDSLGAGGERHHRAARVVSAWVREPLFRGQGKKPEPLPFDGAERSFSELVRRYGGDVPPRAVLDELERVGAVEVLTDGRIRLKVRAYIPHRGSAEKLAILGEDVGDLAAAIDHNLDCPAEEAFFQRKVAYDNLPRECLEELRAFAHKKGQPLLESADRLFAEHDRDANPKSEGTGRARAVIGIYYYEEDVPEEEAPRPGSAAHRPEEGAPRKKRRD